MKNKKEKFYSGFVTIIGKPNVGKSTLMNVLIGEKIAITSSKPQTTRNKITTILTRDDFQIIFIDTPGIHKSKSKLGEYMNKSVDTSLNDVDAILYLIEPRKKILEEDLAIINRFKNSDSNIFLIINKIDTIEKPEILEIIDTYRNLYDFKGIIPISASNGTNTEMVLEEIKKILPEGPKYFPDDMITDQPEKQIVAEIIREKILRLTHEEVPHGTAVEINVMKKRKNRDLVDVEATVYVERETHKGIIIGKNGSMLKDIGVRARRDIERFLGSQIHLDIWIKVKKDWRDSDFYLRNFGYDSKNL